MLCHQLHAYVVKIGLNYFDLQDVKEEDEKMVTEFKMQEVLQHADTTHLLLSLGEVKFKVSGRRSVTGGIAFQKARLAYDAVLR